MAEKRDITAKTGRRRRLVSVIKASGISLVVAAGALAFGADWIRERSQFLRAVTWMDADVGDIERFPTRNIATGPDIDPLHPGTGHEFLFDTVLLVSDGDTLRQDFDQFLGFQDTWAFLMLRGDSLIRERYFDGRSTETIFTTFSASKSVLSAAVGAATDRGLVGGTDDPITDYVPELLDRDPRFAGLNAFAAANSDVVTFHSYEDAETVKQLIGHFEQSGRPIVCTEYLARTTDSHFKKCLTDHFSSNRRGISQLVAEEKQIG